MAKKLNINNPLFDATPAEDQESPQEKKKTGRPRKDTVIRDNSVQAGLTEDYTRATFILKVETLDALKDYAFTKRLSIKDALEDILGGFIADYKANPDNEPLLPHKK